jgi:hypothetical protein
MCCYDFSGSEFELNFIGLGQAHVQIKTSDLPQVQEVEAVQNCRSKLINIQHSLTKEFTDKYPRIGKNS